jgi:glycosyltransferase involved in cell wall biosynthesis
MIEMAAVAVMLLRDVPLFHDALPTKLLEYMAAGRPVVAAAAGQVAELVSSAEAGIVCPPEDAVAVAAAVRRLAANDAEGRRMGANGRRYVEDHLSRDVMVDQLDRELERMLGTTARTLEPVASS